MGKASRQRKTGGMPSKGATSGRPTGAPVQWITGDMKPDMKRDAIVAARQAFALCSTRQEAALFLKIALSQLHGSGWNVAVGCHVSVVVRYLKFTHAQLQVGKCAASVEPIGVVLFKCADDLPPAGGARRPLAPLLGGAEAGDEASSSSTPPPSAADVAHAPTAAADGGAGEEGASEGNAAGAVKQSRQSTSTSKRASRRKNRVKVPGLLVVTSDMPESLEDFTLTALHTAAVSANTLVDVGRGIKKALTEEFGPTWQVVIGEQTTMTCQPSYVPQTCLEVNVSRLIPRCKAAGLPGAPGTAAAAAVETAAAAATAEDKAADTQDPNRMKIIVYKSIPKREVELAGKVPSRLGVKHLRLTLFMMAMVLFVAFMYIRGYCDQSCAGAQVWPEGMEPPELSADVTPLPEPLAGAEELDSEFDAPEAESGEADPTKAVDAGMPSGAANTNGKGEARDLGQDGSGGGDSGVGGDAGSGLADGNGGDDADKGEGEASGSSRVKYCREEEIARAQSCQSKSTMLMYGAVICLVLSPASAQFFSTKEKGVRRRAVAKAKEALKSD